MIKQLFNTKNIDGLLVFLVLLISSRASVIANADSTLFITLFINLYVMVRRNIKIDKPFIVVVVAFLLLVLQNYYQNDGDINLLRYVKLFSIISIAYFTIKITGFSFFSYYNTFMYAAILCSLPFYLWQVLSTDSLHSFGTALSNIFPGLVDNLPSSQNILFHTIEFVDKYRNSGPMWEPGGFATMIVLAIYFEFLKNKFTINKRVLVYFFGVLITFSTTGYLLCMILMFVYLINMIRTKSPRRRFSLYLLVIPGFLMATVAVFFSSDLMYNKIQFLYNDQMSKVEDMEHVESLGLDAKFSLGRFGSLLVDLRSMQENLFFGRGYDDDHFRHGNFESFNLTNGLSNYIARLGILGFIWLLISLSKSGRLLVFALSGSVGKNNILILIVPLIAFSNPVLFTPLYLLLSFLFIPFKPTNTQPIE